MADPHNSPIHVVPDPKPSNPQAAAATPERKRSGRGVAIVLGGALVGSLVGNGLQYMDGRQLQDALEETTIERNAVVEERDQVRVELAAIESALATSRDALGTVHTGLIAVREQLTALESLTAPQDARAAVDGRSGAAVAADPDVASTSEEGIPALEILRTPASESEPVTVATPEVTPESVDPAADAPESSAPERAIEQQQGAPISTDPPVIAPETAAVDSNGATVAAIETRLDDGFVRPAPEIADPLRSLAPAFTTLGSDIASEPEDTLDAVTPAPSHVVPQPADPAPVPPESTPAKGSFFERLRAWF